MATSRTRSAARAEANSASTASARIPVRKTYKLYVGGQFPRSESGRSYVVRSPDTVQAVAALMERFPDRFLFGTDEVGPKDQVSIENLGHGVFAVRRAVPHHVSGLQHHARRPGLPRPQ